ncbi:MAG: hypothetical protein LBB61_08080 [Treponema sp.]|jgi:hypothetical protein|nr:hypothetical protein [Treponema sp.]
MGDHFLFVIRREKGSVRLGILVFAAPNLAIFPFYFLTRAAGKKMVTYPYSWHSDPEKNSGFGTYTMVILKGIFAGAAVFSLFSFLPPFITFTRSMENLFYAVIEKLLLYRRFYAQPVPLITGNPHARLKRFLKR